MSFATNFIERRRIIEDALAKVLEPHFDLVANSEGERCVLAPGWADIEADVVPLWTLASELEVLLS